MSFLRMVQRGNVERIKELDKLGQRPDAIVKGSTKTVLT